MQCRDDEDRTQLTTNFNDLIARYASSATVVYTLQIFEKRERERKKGVHICATRTLMIEQANEREEREQKKKKEAMLKSHLLLYVSHSITIQL